MNHLRGDGFGWHGDEVGGIVLVVGRCSRWPLAGIRCVLCRNLRNVEVSLGDNQEKFEREISG